MISKGGFVDKITIEVDDLTKVSDGYHTIEELYEHRNLLFINFVLAVKDKYEVLWRSDDYTPGWFIVYVELPTGQISYHLPDNYHEYIKDFPEASDSYWDGHTSEDVQRRLHENTIKTVNNEFINCYECRYYNDDLIQPNVGQCMNDNVPRDTVRQFETCSKGEKDV